jgi:hypothetical protein
MSGKQLTVMVSHGFAVLQQSDDIVNADARTAMIACRRALQVAAQYIYILLKSVP